MQYSDDSAAPGEEPEYEGFDLDKYKRMWRDWVDLYGDARRQSFKDQEYYDGDVTGTGLGHWTQTELNTLAERNQPPSVFNLIKRKINAIAGVEQRTRAEPRALPRTPKDQKAAEVATDALRFVKERTRSGQVSAVAFLDALIAGYAGSEIGGAKDHVPETHVPWRDIAFDPFSRRNDFSDASWRAIAKWLDVDVAKSIYVPPEPPRPDPLPAPQIPPQPSDPAQAQRWAAIAQQIIARYEAEVAQQEMAYQRELARRQRIIDAIESTADGGGSDALAEVDYDDHPGATFCDRKRKRIFVVDMWHKDAEHGWYRCVFTGADKLFTEPATLVEKDPLTNREVKVPPLNFFSLYVSKDGWRYGEVRGMRSPQDEVNMRRSKALHLLTVNQIINRTGNHSAVEEGGKEQLRREAARPDGYLDVPDPTLLRIEKNMDLAQGQQRLGEEARQFMEMEGPNPQLQGEQGRATSGRAVLALQQAGLGQLGPVFERKHEWDDARFRSYWARIQQFWDAEMYVRVTDDKNAARFAAVNGAPVLDQEGNPVPKRRPMMMQPGGSDMPMHQMPGGQMMPGAYHGEQMPMGQQMGMGSGMGDGPPMLGHNGGPPIDPSEFETGPMLAELDMDIIIDRAPEAATLQAEQFEELVKLAQAQVLPPGPDTARMIITASALPTKSELLDMLDKMAAKPQGPSPQEQAMLKKLAAEIENLMARSQQARATAAKTAAEIPKTQAETAKAGAEARSAHVDATMNEFGAESVLDNVAAFASAGLGGSPMNDPMAAASPPGAIGSPPSEANGPPPF